MPPRVQLSGYLSYRIHPRTLPVTDCRLRTSVLMRTILLGAAGVEVQRMDVELEAAVPGDLFLALLDLGVEELLPEPCLKRSGRNTGLRCSWYGSAFVDPVSDRRSVLLRQFQ